MMKKVFSNGQINVTLIQYTQGEVDYIISRGKYTDSFIITAEEANHKVSFLKSQGFKAVKEPAPKEPKQKEQKVSAPKEQKTRAEALTEKYGDITVRRAYMAHKGEVIKTVRSEIAEWAKTHRRLTKEEYRKVLNSEVAKRMIQYKTESVAIGG